MTTQNNLELEAVADSNADPVQQEKIAFLMKELGIEPQDLLATSYGALLGAE